MRHRHPANVVHHDQADFGARAADRVASFMGSWRFIGLQSAFIVLWIALNAYLLTQPFDPAPFILLNLGFSTQAAYAAPILQLASNRQSEHDRLRAEADHESLELLRTVNQEQLEILARQDELLDAIHGAVSKPAA